MTKTLLTVTLVFAIIQSQAAQPLTSFQVGIKIIDTTPRAHATVATLTQIEQGVQTIIY
jgi:hypothetical protein